LNYREFQLVLNKGKKLPKKRFREVSLACLLAALGPLSLAPFPFPIHERAHGEDLPEEQDEE